MIDWISDGLKSLLLIEDAFATQNFASSEGIPPTESPGFPETGPQMSLHGAADFQEYALCCSEENIGAADRLRIADKRHTAILHLTDLISEILDLLFHDCLQTEMAWDD